MASKAGGNLDAFRKTYDKSLIVPQKIQAALAQLGDAWEVEGDFVKRCGISQTEFGMYKERFVADYVVEVTLKGTRRRVWAGTKKFAAAMRDIIAGQ